MDERPDEIIGHIEAQRDQLGRNLNELETRVRENADWRTWFDRNPMMMMGAALGGGLLVGTMIGGKTPRLKRSRSRKVHDRMEGDIYGSSTAGVTASSFTSERSSATSQQVHHKGENRIKSAVSSLKHSESWHQVSDTLEDVKAALIAFGTVKAKEFLNQSIPGFEDHLNEARQRREGRTGKHDEHHTSSGDQQHTTSFEQGDTGSHTEHHRRPEGGSTLYTPSGEQVMRSGSYSSDPVGTYRP